MCCGPWARKESDTTKRPNIYTYTHVYVCICSTYRYIHTHIYVKRFKKYLPLLQPMYLGLFHSVNFF